MLQGFEFSVSNVFLIIVHSNITNKECGILCKLFSAAVLRVNIGEGLSVF